MLKVTVWRVEPHESAANLIHTQIKATPNEDSLWSSVIQSYSMFVQLLTYLFIYSYTVLSKALRCLAMFMHEKLNQDQSGTPDLCLRH